jgi:hypothetical protein
MKRFSTAALFLVGLIVVSALLAIACADEDKKDWQEADKANTVEAFEQYVQRHPEGKYGPQARERMDDLHWQEAETADTVPALEQYLQRQPGGKYVAQAGERIEGLDWQEAETANTVAAYERYLDRHSDGRYVAQAGERIEGLHWQEAGTANTISSYQQYLESYPSGRYAEEANQRVASLADDDSPFLAAQQEGTRKAFEDFLAKFPGHRWEADARSALDDIVKDMEGRDIVDLIAENKAEAKPKGSGIESVSLEVRRLVNHEITVLIPIGTFFASAGSAQDMVTTNVGQLVLKDNEWHSVSVSAACANLHARVPGGQDTFNILRTPQQELEKLMGALAKTAGLDSAVRQAAVWIVTDNANYAGLGTLVGSITRARVINETKAAQAMKAVDDAGIDITQKAIWWDRSQILQGLQDETLRNWLQQRGG